MGERRKENAKVKAGKVKEGEKERETEREAERGRE